MSKNTYEYTLPEGHPEATGKPIVVETDLTVYRVWVESLPGVPGHAQFGLYTFVAATSVRQAARRLALPRHRVSGYEHTPHPDNCPEGIHAALSNPGRVFWVTAQDLTGPEEYTLWDPEIQDELVAHEAAREAQRKAARSGGAGTHA